MNQAKLQSLLQPDHVLRADDVCAPQRLVKVFAIPPAKLRSAMIDIIKRPGALEHPFDLPEFANITACIEGRLDVSAQTEAKFVRLMVEVTRNDVMPARSQFCDQSRTNRSQPTCHEDPLVFCTCRQKKQRAKSKELRAKG